MVLLGLVALSLSRIGLVLWQWERVYAAGILGRLLVQGVRADFILLGYLVLLPVLLAPLLAHRAWAGAWRLFSAAWATLALICLVFMELSSPQLAARLSVCYA